MANDSLIKNIPQSEALVLNDLVEYQEGQVVSRTLAQNPALSMTLFAFDKGEGISAHTVPADAMVQILDGQAVIRIGEEELSASAGQVVVMPQGAPHALRAEERFKMLLFVVKQPQKLEL